MQNENCNSVNNSLQDEVKTKLDETRMQEIKIGVVTGCDKLNVRAEPSITSAILCEISKQTEVIVDEIETINEFYKICTDFGIEGFCMKKYITVQQ